MNFSRAVSAFCIVVTLIVSGCATPRFKVASLQAFGDESRILSDIVQLTSQDMGFLKAGEAYFSPDMKSIIFQATPLGESEYQIYTMDLASGEVHMVSTGKGACTCAFYHPSGDKIIFASTHLSPDQEKPKDDDGGYAWTFHEQMDIFEADPDGSNLKRLTDAPGYDAEGSYSADGRHIVFTSNRDGDLEIYTMSADGTDQRRMTRGTGYDGGPFYSPDGTTILYRGDRRTDGKQNLQLRMVQADGTNDRAITDNDVFNWCPYWHPAASALIFTQADHEAYSRGKKPNYDLYMTTTAGDRFVRITFEPAFDGLPVFSPDGKKLMWTSMRGGLDEAQIFLADFQVPDDFK